MPKIRFTFGLDFGTSKTAISFAQTESLNPPILDVTIHGDDDRIITPAQTELLHQALLAAGADSTRYLLTGAGHGQLSLTGRQAQQWTSTQVMTIIKDFLDEHLRS